MQTQTLPTKKVEFVYILFTVWAIFSVCFMFLDLNVVAFLKISIFTTPVFVLNIFAVALYLFMPPRKSALGIIASLFWLGICMLLFASQFSDKYQGAFGSFIWLLRSLPYEVLIMIGMAITLYLLLLPFKIVAESVEQPLIAQGPRDYFKGLALPCLAGLAASIFHAVNNVDFLTPITGCIFIVFFVLFVALLYSMLCFSCRKVLPYKDISLITTLCFMAWMFLPTAVALLRLFYHPLSLHVGFLTIIPVLLFYLFHKKPSLVAVYLLLSIPISGYTYLNSQPFNMAEVRKVEKTDYFKVPPLPAQSIADGAPNVYIIVYDGTPNLQELEKLQVDGAELKEILTENNFKIYDNTYSISQVSLTSMSSTYNISLPINDANIIWQANGGLAAGFEAFRKNGYRVESIQQSFMTGAYQYFDVNLPPREFSLVEKGDFLYFLFKAIFAGEFQFEDIISAGGDLSIHKKEVLESGAQRRVVVIHNYYPGHSQLSGACLPNQKEIYETRFAMARDMLREDLARIKTHDPNAIIVVMGDHGPYLTGDCTSLAKNNPLTVTEEEVFDRFSTLMAIYWPDKEKGAKYGHDVRINQDLLPVIFAYLYDSEEPLQWKIPPKAMLNGRLVIDNGLYCPVETTQK